MTSLLCLESTLEPVTPDAEVPEERGPPGLEPIGAEATVPSP
jgi:hypothetical protein